LTAAAPPQNFDRTRLAAARLRAADAQPFLALALYALIPITDPNRGTFAVDEAWRMYVDPACLAEWSVAEVAGVLLHEVGHLIRDHAGRARTIAVVTEREARVWNIAADAEINDDLQAGGVELPGRCVLPSSLKQPAHRSAEFYYDRLIGMSTPPPPIADCGPGCHGQGEPRYDGEIGQGASPVDAMLLRRRVAEDVIRLAALGRGAVAAGWIRWAEANLRPQIDWRKLLATTIRSSVAAVAGAADYSYRRPPRRRVPQVVLPSLQRPVPRVAVVIDTSGSVDNDLLNVAWVEVNGCLRHLGVRRDLLSVYAVDTQAQRLRTPITRRVALTGGGGTDMGVGISAALVARPKIDLIVVITDGMTPWPDRRPTRPVVVALLPGPSTWPTPKWARVVQIPAIETSQ